jgi:hypothetical protein
MLAAQVSAVANGFHVCDISAEHGKTLAFDVLERNEDRTSFYCQSEVQNVFSVD